MALVSFDPFQIRLVFRLYLFFLERTLIEHIDINYNVALILSFILSIYVLLQMFFVLDLESEN